MHSPVRANHNLKAPAALLRKSWVYSIFFQKVVQSNADWQAGQSYIDPAVEELTQWSGTYSLDQLFLFEVFPQSVIHCVVLSHMMAHPERQIAVAVLFYRELRMLLKLES